MAFLMLQAYGALIRLEPVLRNNDFPGLYSIVRNHSISTRVRPSVDVDRICSAIDTACVWYSKHVLCLQRSAATTCLLRKYGFPAQMVIGARLWPFASHAWVEIGRRVINDKTYMQEKFSLILDRC
jgi:hypothetical protein